MENIQNTIQYIIYKIRDMELKWCQIDGKQCKINYISNNQLTVKILHFKTYNFIKYCMINEIQKSKFRNILKGQFQFCILNF
jgi:hypothetical protein